MFKNDFLWGGTVAAHQLEGGWKEGGKGVSIADVMTAGANAIARKINDGIIARENYPNHDAIDFYSRYKEDIALFVEMGFIYVDKDNDGKGTLKRSRKESFKWYKNVIATNGEEL